MIVFEVPFYENSLRVAGTDRGVTKVLWQKRKANETIQPTPLEKEFRQKLQKFLKGQGSLDIAIDWKNLPGTEFQQMVWRQMCKIPFGQIRSYGEIAKSLKKPGAARAVGTACGKNPALLAIPCHRVVGSKGLGGFSGGGLTVKRQLLHLEGARP